MFNKCKWGKTKRYLDSNSKRVSFFLVCIIPVLWFDSFLDLTIDPNPICGTLLWGFIGAWVGLIAVLIDSINASEQQTK